jgi:hypothetical protein
MRGPICVAKERGHDEEKFVKRDFYLRRPWMRLFSLTTFRAWDSIIFGDTTGIELNIGKLHLELQHREDNA